MGMDIMNYHVSKVVVHSCSSNYCAKFTAQRGNITSELRVYESAPNHTAFLFFASLCWNQEVQSQKVLRFETHRKVWSRYHRRLGP